MPGQPSAYAVLGLDPGADRAAIDAAYRELIKRYHPDRTGGDPQRAAEINRAYRELRDGALAAPAVQRATAPRTSRRRSRGRRIRRRARPGARLNLWAAIGLAGIAAVLLQGGKFDDFTFDWLLGGSEFPASGAAGRRTQSAPLDAPLTEGDIVLAVSEAWRLRQDPEAAANFSRTCYQGLRRAPKLALLDACAAFDDAAAILIERDEARDSGPFAASAITARQVNAGSLLSDNYLEIEARLNHVRARVERLLAPAIAVEPAQARSVAVEEVGPEPQLAPGP
jgi:curved DNA-binding protein CbpA